MCLRSCWVWEHVRCYSFAQDEPYDHVLRLFTTAVTRAVSVNPNTATEIFINEVDDGISFRVKSNYDYQCDITALVFDEIHWCWCQPWFDANTITSHTSIYDSSIYEALLRVVQRLIAQLPTLKNVLNVLVATGYLLKGERRIYIFNVVPNYTFQWTLAFLARIALISARTWLMLWLTYASEIYIYVWDQAIWKSQSKILLL